MTPKEIENLNYVEFISLLNETNRCPGGKQTIRKVLQDTFINSSSSVLEVGSNTGFTSLEIARTVKCHIIGIDPIENAVKAANEILKQDTEEIQSLIKFQVGSAYEIPFKDNTFDLLICGGATSFMDEKSRAIKEYYRVLKPWSFLSVTNLCYLKEPPKKVVDDTSDIIGVKLNNWGPEKYMDLFTNQNLFEVYNMEQVYLGEQTENRIDEYINYFMKKEHIAHFSLETKKVIEDRWRKTINIFNENHKYLGFIRIVFRKRYLEEEPELFLPHK